MKSNVKSFANFLAAAVWADGEYNEYEKEFVGEVATILEIPNFDAELQNAIKATEKLESEALTDLLVESAKSIDKKEREAVLSTCLTMLCCDAYFSKDEMENYFVFAEILGVDDDRAQELLDSYIDEEEDLIVEDQE